MFERFVAICFNFNSSRISNQFELIVKMMKSVNRSKCLIIIMLS
jgi:hypothetical protein